MICVAFSSCRALKSGICVSYQTKERCLCGAMASLEKAPNCQSLRPQRWFPRHCLDGLSLTPQVLSPGSGVASAILLQWQVCAQKRHKLSTSNQHHILTCTAMLLYNIPALLLRFLLFFFWARIRNGRIKLAVQSLQSQVLKKRRTCPLGEQFIAESGWCSVFMALKWKSLSRLVFVAETLDWKHLFCQVLLVRGWGCNQPTALKLQTELFSFPKSIHCFLEFSE